MNLNLVTITASIIEKSIDFNNIPGFKFIGKALHYTGFAYSGANSTSSIHKGKVLLTQVVQIYFEVDDVVYFVNELAKKAVKIQNKTCLKAGAFRRSKNCCFKWSYFNHLTCCQKTKEYSIDGGEVICSVKYYSGLNTTKVEFFTISS